MLSKEGKNVVALGDKKDREIEVIKGLKKKLHSLGSVNFLKIEPSNHIFFSFSSFDNRTINIQEQYTDHIGDTHFEDIYKVQAHEPSLRELLLIQSMYCCHTQSEIEHLVNDQPNPSIFFKMFFELRFSTFLSFLSFDAHAMHSLLDYEKNAEYFTDEFPLFFKNDNGLSAIDTALDHN